MKKFFLCFVFVSVCVFKGHSKENYEYIYPPPPPTLVFFNIGWNLLGSVTHNYGANFAGAGLGTWACIETGIDWEWRNIAFKNEWLANCGLPGLYIGYIVPALAPVLAFSAGRLTHNYKLQMTAFALVQSLMLTLAVQTPLKMITGRALPGIVTELDHARDFRPNDFSREFEWFNLNFIGGWPSGHTANAFSAAATVAELYKDNVWLKIGVYSYAALIGFGVTLNVHWASEALAGALIGYAVGKTVGKSFNKRLKGDYTNAPVSFYVSPNSLGIIVLF